MDELDLSSRTGPPDGALNGYVIATDRLDLALTELKDTRALFGLLSGPERDAITATLRWDGPDSFETFSDFAVNIQQDPYEIRGFHWTIRDRLGDLTGTAGEAIGHIGTRKLEAGRGDVGYWLGRPYWGNGIMTEALAAVRDLCFSELNLAKLEAQVFEENEAGNRLVQTIGMSLEGTTRRYLLKRGRWVDANLYGMLFEEWLSTNQGSR